MAADLDAKLTKSDGMSGISWRLSIDDPEDKMTMDQFNAKHGFRYPSLIIHEMQDHCILKHRKTKLEGDRIKLEVSAYNWRERGGWTNQTYVGTEEVAGGYFLWSQIGETVLCLDSRHRDRSDVSRAPNTSHAEHVSWLKGKVKEAIASFYEFDPSLKRLDDMWPYRLLKITLLDLPALTVTVGVQTEDNPAKNYVLECRDNSGPKTTEVEGNLIDLSETDNEDDRPTSGYSNYTAYTNDSYDSVYYPNPEC